MANIIEKEIAKRKEIIDGKAEKEARLEKLKAEVITLAEEIASIDTEILEAEIAELESYIKVDEVTDETVEG